ncbi:MAG TPA: phosphatase PAP2 family protein [Chthoniobacterales bacterium]|nr:phosphatase PAP2 family protein [Chthoniobacterales bacterium]
MRIAAAAIACGLLLGAFLSDASVDQWVATHRSVTWETAAKLCSRYSAWHWLMLAALIGAVIAWLRRRHDWLRMLCVMAVAASLAGLAADLLRGITGRTRPYAQVPQGFYGVRDGSQWLITKHAYNSFPSGHTAAVTGLLVPLIIWRRRLAWAALLLVCVVGAARVYLGAHHSSDIVAGALLGVIVAIAVVRRLPAPE